MKKGKKKHTRFYDSSVIRKIAIVDSVVGWIEKVSGQINSWAWTKRWKNRKEGTGYASNNLEYGVQLKETTSKEWIKGYKEWEKRKKN